MPLGHRLPGLLLADSTSHLPHFLGPAETRLPVLPRTWALFTSVSLEHASPDPGWSGGGGGVSRMSLLGTELEGAAAQDGQPNNSTSFRTLTGNLRGRSRTQTLRKKGRQRAGEMAQLVDDTVVSLMTWNLNGQR